MRNKILTKIKSLFELDLRSLAFARIAVGLVLLKDLFEMIPLINMFYTKEGFLPLEIFIPQMAHDWSWSLFNMSDHPIFVKLLFGIYFIFLLFFIIGYKTKLSNIILWIFIVSMHNRNWAGLNGGDDLIRTCLLILSFLPLGARYSIDFSLAQKKDEQISINSLWGFTLFIQLALMYICSALHKTSPVWMKDYTALSFVAYLDAFTKFPAEYLKSIPFLPKILTFISYNTERYLPFLILAGLIPRLKIPTRYIVLFGFIFFHLGIQFFMNVGNFAFYAIALWTAFLPSHFWNKVSYTKYSHLNVYYDGYCGFCGKLSRILLTFLASKELHLHKAQTNIEINKKMLEKNSWVVQSMEGKNFYGFEAFLEVLRRSHFQFFYPLLSLNFFKTIGIFIYQFVAKNRSFFSSLTSPLKYQEKLTARNSIFTELLALPLLVMISFWCLNAARVPYFEKNIPIISDANRWLHTYQAWNIFAPYPKNTNIWFNIKGVLENKAAIDLTHPLNIKFDMKVNPNIIRERFENKSLRKVFMRMEGDHRYREFLANYYCRSWKNPKLRLDKVEIFMGKELIYEPHKVRPFGMELIHSKFCP